MSAATIATKNIESKGVELWTIQKKWVLVGEIF